MLLAATQCTDVVYTGTWFSSTSETLDLTGMLKWKYIKSPSPRLKKGVSATSFSPPTKFWSLRPANCYLEFPHLFCIHKPLLVCFAWIPTRSVQSVLYLRSRYSATWFSVPVTFKHYYSSSESTDVSVLCTLDLRSVSCPYIMHTYVVTFICKFWLPDPYFSFLQLPPAM
jgi:hypothetical protein